MLAPGVLALAVMSTAFTSLAIATGFERRYGLIKRLGASPLPRSGLLLGKVGALLLVEVAQVVVIGAVALAMGWSPDPAGLPGVVAAVLAGTFAFASLGLLMAGTLRAEATLAAANLVYLLLLAGGAVRDPGVDVRRVRRAGPLAALRRARRVAAAGHPGGGLPRRRAGGAAGLGRAGHGADRPDLPLGVSGSHRRGPRRTAHPTAAT